MQITPTQDDVIKALLTVLAAILPTGTVIALGQANRVPTPSAKNYVYVTPLRRTRIETNTNLREDCRIVGGIAGKALTVTSTDFANGGGSGVIVLGSILFGPGVADGTIIISQDSGAPGGPGVYALSTGSTVNSGTVLACGATGVSSPYELDVQVDVHGSGASSQAADNAQMISTLFRDDWASVQFAAIAPAVTPLHADDPRFMPGFVDGESQYEDRWIVEVHLQVNETMRVPQQYADRVAAGLIDVDVEYPA